MLKRLAQLILINVVACGACSAQGSADSARPSAAADVLSETNSNEAVNAGGASPNVTIGSGTICPKMSAEMARISGSPLWLQSFDVHEITSVASDSRGNVVLARAGAGVSKLGCDGAQLWSQPFGAQLAIDDHDEVYVAGAFTGALAIGATTLEAQGTEAFLVKLDADGNAVYARSLGAAADGAVESVAVDSAHEVAISGPVLGTVKLDSAGGVLWRKAFSGQLRFDAGGNLLVAGQLVGSLDFGAGTLTSQGGSDILLLKLAADGTPIFSRSYGDAGALQRADALAVDGHDNIVIAGTFDGRVDFGAGALDMVPAQCSSDAWCVTDGFVAKFDAQGQAVWSVALGPMRAVSGAAVDVNGAILLSGALPGGVRPFRQTWLAKLDEKGAELWHRSEWPDSGIGAGHEVAVDRDAQVFWALSARPSLELEEQSYLVKLSP